VLFQPFQVGSKPGQHRIDVDAADASRTAHRGIETSSFFTGFVTFRTALWH